MHSHDLFLAALAADSRGLARARYFLFIRGLGEYFEIDPASVRMIQAPNPYAEVIRSCRRTMSGPVTAVERRPPALPVPAGQGQGFGLLGWFWALFLAVFRSAAGTGGERNDDQHDGPPMSQSRDDVRPVQAPGQPVSLPEWTQTNAGRDALAADSAWLANDHPEFRLVNRGGTLLWTGVKAFDEMSLAVTLAYPADYPATSPIVDITGHTDNLDIKVQAILLPEGGSSYRKQLFTLMRSVTTIGGSRRVNSQQATS